MRARFGVLVLLAGSGVDAAGWSDLHGEWRGSGTVRGMAAEVSLAFRPVLDGRGHALGFVNRMRGDDGKEWVFQAEAIYLCAAPEPPCRGHWYDSRGVTLPVVAQFEDVALVVDWGDDATERGRTRYALQADGSLQVHDEVRTPEGTWRLFGEVGAVRAPRQP